MWKTQGKNLVAFNCLSDLSVEISSLNEHQTKNMRISLFLTTVFATDEVPHDPEALAFCHNACKVRPINPSVAAATFLMQIF